MHNLSEQGKCVFAIDQQEIQAIAYLYVRASRQITDSYSTNADVVWFAQTD